jgi:replicative DNA helicase
MVKKNPIHLKESFNEQLIGKIPPQARELEAAVLGAMLLEENCVSVVADILQAESFYVEANKVIYQSILNLIKRSEPIDILTVTENLRKCGTLELAGGSYYLIELTTKIATSANVEYHARIVAQKYFAREIIKMSSYNIERAYNDEVDILVLVDTVAAELNTIIQRGYGGSVPDIRRQTKETIEYIKKMMLGRNSIPGIPVYLNNIDKHLGGYNEADLIIIAARPGMGKTTYVWQNIISQTEHGHCVAMFSLEMSVRELLIKMLANKTGINSAKFKFGNLQEGDMENINQWMQWIENSKLIIDDNPSNTLSVICSKARVLKASKDIEAIYIDYLQLLQLGAEQVKRNNNRDQDIGEMTRTLKRLAKELKIPIIVLAQLSRATEKEKNKLPGLSDLRESGNIEQDADEVMFLYRPEYYGMLKDEVGNLLEGLTKVICAKHRDGATFEAKLKFSKAISKFEDYIEDADVTINNKNNNSYEGVEDPF